MMIVDFETAAFADALKKASPIGKEFGVRIVATNDELRVEAASREVTYRQVILDAGVEEAGSVVVTNPAFSALVSKLPAGSATHLEYGEKLELTCGKVQAVYAVISDAEAEDYPDVPLITQDLVEVEDFSSSLSSVSFAASKDEGNVMNGVHVDGDWIIATDKYKVARIALRVPIAEPITIPIRLVASVVPKRSAVMIGSDGIRFSMKPDPETDITATVFAGGYPNTSQFWAEKQKVPRENKFEIDIDDLAGVLYRATAMASMADTPKMELSTGEPGEFKAKWWDSNGNAFMDALPYTHVSGDTEVSVILDPTIVNGILNQHRGGGKVVMSLPDAGSLGFLQFDCLNGLSVVCAPIRFIN